MKRAAFIPAVMLLLSGCISDDDNGIDCGDPVLLDNDIYENALSDPFELEETEIHGDSIKVVIRYGGGCGEVCVQLAGAEDVMYSDPPQRNIRVLFEDHDPCEALIAETFRFDLTPLRVVGSNRVRLNLRDWEEPLLYEY